MFISKRGMLLFVFRIVNFGVPKIFRTKVFPDFEKVKSHCSKQCTNVERKQSEKERNVSVYSRKKESRPGAWMIMARCIDAKCHLYLERKRADYWPPV